MTDYQKLFREQPMEAVSAAFAFKENTFLGAWQYSKWLGEAWRADLINEWSGVSVHNPTCTNYWTVKASENFKELQAIALPNKFDSASAAIAAVDAILKANPKVVLCDPIEEAVKQ